MDETAGVYITYDGEPISAMFSSSHGGGSEDSENITGNGFVSRGICAGYACSYNADDNPITEILNGHVQFKIALAPYTPAEFIEFVFSFDTSALETALNS